MVATTLVSLSLAAAAVARSVTAGGSGCNNAWSKTNFKSLVTFGDSYTDDSRLGYFGSHNGSAPPVGWVDPVNYNSATGGRTWAQYVSQYGGQKLYNYAVSGAVCSNNITPRTWATINAPFPDLDGYEVPAYLADKAYKVNGKPFLDVPAKKTVYAIWDGTNDLGNYALLDDSQVRGTNITSYLDCIYKQVDRLYASGARYFVLMNAAPLFLLPLYATPENGGVANDNFWPDKPSNITEISYRMLESVVTVNDIYDYRTPVDVVIKKKYPGANFAVFSTYSLMSDIYYNPTQYLNGTSAPKTTIPDKKCNAQSQCTTAGDHDSYVWFDDLHPSEQTSRVIAREFVKVIKGSSSYATYWN